MTNEDLVYYLILIPFMGSFLVFNILPVLSSVTLSFFDYDMVSTPQFIGLENYIRMFTADRLFTKVVGTTLRFSVIAGPLGYMLAFLLAWMINEFPRPVFRRQLCLYKQFPDKLRTDFRAYTMVSERKL